MRRHFSRLARFKPLLLVPALAAAGIATHGCKARQDGSGLKTNDSDYDKATLDVNDLSYLLPKDKFGRIYPLIKVSESWGENLARYGRTDVPQAEGIMRNEVYNDVLAATTDPNNFIAANPSATDGQPKMPFAVGDQTDFEYPNMVVTSFRIDPCAPSLTLDSARSNFQPTNSLLDQTAKQIVKDLNAEITRLGLGFQLGACQTQVRLIIQPASADFTTLKESTIHMVFTLNGGSGIMDRKHQDAVLALKRELDKATGVDTTGLMLQPHPGLAREGSRLADEATGGTGGRLVIEYLYNMLGSYPDSQVMAIIREKTDENGIQHDVVLGGGTRNGNYFPNNLTSSNPSKGFLMTSSKQRGSQWTTKPSPVVIKDANADTAPLSNILMKGIDLATLQNLKGKVGSGGLLSPQENETVQDLRTVMIADDPESTHFFVNDCITCHASSQIINELPSKSVASTIATRYVVPAGVSGYPIGAFLPGPVATEGGIMMRNLGYSRNRPIIGLRTVTETAALADYFNRDLRGLPNPGADCGQNEARVWQRAMEMKNYKLDYEKFAAKTSADRAAPEDDLFASPNCQGGVLNKNIAPRGDGTNVPVLGQVQSPFVGNVTYSGIVKFAKGPARVTVTLGNGNGGRTMEYFVDGLGIFKGSWNLDTANKITTTGENMMFSFDVVGGAICDATKLATCLTLGKGFKNFGPYAGPPAKNPPLAGGADPAPANPANPGNPAPANPDPVPAAGAGGSTPSGIYVDGQGRSLGFSGGSAASIPGCTNGIKGTVGYIGGQIKADASGRPTCVTSFYYCADANLKSVNVAFSQNAGKCPNSDMWMRYSQSKNQVCFVGAGSKPSSFPTSFAPSACYNNQ